TNGEPRRFTFAGCCTSATGVVAFSQPVDKGMTMKGCLSVRFFGLACAVLLGLAGGAIAQQQTATPSEIKGDQLQEVVVTATKRETTVETTPISITAITGQELQDRGITDMQSIVQSVP